MVIFMKEKIYNLATLWLTLSVLFFLVEYATGWLEVVTLGGLVAGAFIEGVFVVIGLKLKRFVVSKYAYFSLTQFVANRSDALKALVVTAAFSMEGVLTICRALPGYSLNFSIPHAIFLLLVYPVLALDLERIIMVEGAVASNGN